MDTVTRLFFLLSLVLLHEASQAFLGQMATRHGAMGRSISHMSTMADQPKLGRFDSSIETSNDDSDGDNHRNKKLTELLEHTKGQLLESQRNVTSMEAQLKELNGKVPDLEFKITEMRVKLSEEQRARKTAESALDALKASNEQLTATLNEERIEKLNDAEQVKKERESIRYMVQASVKLARTRIKNKFMDGKTAIHTVFSPKDQPLC
jgi:chromosome segregation ATPase